ncbi:N-acetylmuramic acid 6-phosphate etherase [Allorhizocola rhizosphaerae]|uniref:N-acetylmuramic acid 6-phosphate etherase n=1 Tax=Allorhizocola rhizosphaerae TaxID=1872709 RepID=UPI000E3D4552|nr:N-acetylmuramic acid 6-phosphate etherase [Allorhizocola rhizosphaerae]
MTTLDQLLTEQIDDRYAHLDQAPVAQLAQLMNEADASVPGAVRSAIPQIVPAIEAVVERLAAGGRLIYVGAGSAGRIAVLDASEIPPTFNAPPTLVQAVIAGGFQAVVRTAEGAEDDTAAASLAIDSLEVSASDAVMGIAASGRTPYVLAAMGAARQRGAVTVGLSCNVDTALSAAVDFPIEVPVGPEVLAGSTRLKAGTAQKLVLNMVSTIAMVRLGKAYGNLMVDMRVTNGKLRDRALRIIERVTGCTRAVAEKALHAADNEVKTAIVIVARSSTVEVARQRLAAASGRLRDAL